MKRREEETELPTEPLCDPTVPPLDPLPRAWTSLARAFWECSGRRAGAEAMMDSTGARLTYRACRQRATALARVLGRRLGPAECVGILVPPTVPGAVANLAVTLLGKIPVNLNYTTSDAVVNSAIEQSKITHVITSRKVLARFPIRPSAECIFLEDVPKQVSVLDKVLAGLAGVAPDWVAAAWLPGLRTLGLEDIATIIFTSGSTGEPKGVVLTHRNILSNVHGIDQHVRLRPDEVVLGILPFFHSFGYSVTVWTVLATGKKAVYHTNPLDAKTVGKLVAEQKVTIMAATPTFMRGYLQRCTPDQFQSVRLLLLGAEKLKDELALEIASKLHVEPMQGYGCTETGPVVSVNVPGKVACADGSCVCGNRLGTVGRPLPGTLVKTTDPETGADLERGKEGVIMVKGPQVMRGYLDRPDLTAPVLRDGWYSTGDLGYVDADGFIHITDRLSRFAKIGGEMVPHHRVESAIATLLGEPAGSLAVTSLPDPKRGERLVVVHTGLRVSPAEVCRRLNQCDEFPKLWIPDPDDFVQVEGLPVLGTGKLDLREIRRVAAEVLKGRSD